MLIALALSLLAAAPADTLPGTIRGAVQAEPSGVPLELAVVEVQAGAALVVATSDSAGVYVLRQVPAGLRVLRVRHLGHEPVEMEVLVPAGGQVVLDLFLKPRPLALDTVVASTGGAGGVGDTAQAGGGALAMVGQRVLTEAPGAAAAASPAGGPGGAGGEPGDPRDVLWVRGSAADLKLVLLDGAPVYTPFHMGGLIHTFEPEVLGSARLYLGGAPARYDGGLAYVMEMDTRAGRPDRTRAFGSADLLSARVLAEGPLPAGATYLADARAVDGRAVEALGGEPFPYEYSEGLVRVDLPTGGRGGLALTGFVNEEGVRVDTAATGHDFARWGNAAGSLRWRGRITRGTGLETTAAYSRFYARLPWTTGQREVLMGGDTRRLRLAADLNRGMGALRVRYGAAYDRSWLGNDVWTRGHGELLYGQQNVGDWGGAYADVAWQPAGTLALRGGLRGDYFAAGHLLGLSPRLSATWLMGDHAALTAAGGRYHQYVKVARLLAQTAPGTAADSLGVVTALAVAQATHFSLGLDQELPRTLRLGLEGYFKRYERLTVSRDESYVSGMDVWIRRGEGAVTGWLGYSLTWAWSNAVRSGSGSDSFDGRQVATGGVAGPLGKRGRFGLRVAYGSGLPFTAIQASSISQPNALATGDALNGSGSAEAPPLAETPREPYLRVDAEVSRTWSPSVGGRRLEVTPYVRVLNALDRRDALFYRYDQSSADHLRSIGKLPILPIAGISFRT
jgi:hypothetical protein